MSEYVTKDSGARQEYASGMVRDTQEGKAQFGLLRPEGVPYEEQFLTRVAQLMTRGIGKYGRRNWERADSEEELERFRESAERHLNQYLAGEDDEDHAAAVVFNLLAAETTKYKLSKNDKTAAEIEDLKALTRAYVAEGFILPCDLCGSPSVHRGLSTWLCDACIEGGY